MAAANVDLLEMADTSVACGDGDVLELDVHVVFGCFGEVELEGELRARGERELRNQCQPTFDQLAAVCLAGCDLEGDDVALGG